MKADNQAIGWDTLKVYDVLRRGGASDRAARALIDCVRTQCADPLGFYETLREEGYDPERAKTVVEAFMSIESFSPDQESLQ